MIPYSAYKVLHLLSIFILFSVAGGVALYTANDGRRDANRLRRLVGALHGIALLVILVSGFGMLARLDLPGIWVFPSWLWGKLAIFVALGVLATLPYRKPALGRVFVWLLPLIGAIAAWLALFKPF